MQVKDLAIAARAAARALAASGTGTRNAALHAMADALVQSAPAVLEANQRDLEAAANAGMPASLVDRLRLTRERIAAMAEGVRQVAALADPIGEVVEGWQRPNGLEIQRVRVPFGVIGIIYESRPNVTADAASLCLKAGNACLLRGGSEALHSNTAIVAILRQALAQAGLPEDSIQLIGTADRAAARELMRLNGLVDLLIPRGGAGLIQTVMQEATVPVIETGTGNCHTYVDATADLEMALSIAINAKCSRPSVCNAMETLLLHEVLMDEFLPPLQEAMTQRGVELRGCERTLQALPGITPATEADWETEFLDLILAVKVVDGLDEAIAHINRYGTRHSEAIVTEDYTAAQKFLREVDAACVYVNASTRFTDGFEFGFGAEIGISNQKLHARGPMGLRELTTTKYIVRGSGQVRG
jgi:glutamate-5-semialdehyde dehydrogenase